MTDPSVQTRPRYRWPKIALACVLLFFAMCVLFMLKEVRRLKRDRAADRDMRQSSLPTNSQEVSSRQTQLQFTSRLWNTQGPWGISNGGSTTDLGFQNTWDVTRGQDGATGIIVNYTGGYITDYAEGTPARNRYLFSRTVVNAGIGYQLRPALTFSIDVNNLTDAPQKAYRGIRDQMQFALFGGTTITAGINGRF